MAFASSNDRSSSAWLMLLIPLALAADFLMVPALVMVPEMPLLFFPLLQATLGSILAQGCLLAAWLAWGNGPFWRRFARHWIVAASLYLAWVAGLALGEPGRLPEFGPLVGLTVPLLSLGAQLPLWIARQLFSWRLIRGDERDASPEEPLSIRDLLTATVVVALSLALLRLPPSPDGKPMAAPWVILFAAAATISALTLLPVAPWLMRTPRCERGASFASLYAAFWIGLLWLVVLVGWNGGFFSPPPIAVVIGVSLLIFSFAGTVILAAVAARACGYRLASGRSGEWTGRAE